MAHDRNEATVSLPTDDFSRQLRNVQGHPAAAKASSRIDIADFLGNLETWTIDTFRAPGLHVAFIQKMTGAGSLRLMLPPEVMAVLTRHQASVVAQSRRRGAQQAVATKRAEGTAVGNPEALARARKARKRSQGAK